MRRGPAVVIILLLVSLAGVPSFTASPAFADDWRRVASGGVAGSFNDIQSGACSTASYGGRLYVGTENKTGCEVWCYDGISWTRVVAKGFGDSNNRAACSMVVYAGCLYVGTYRQNGAPQVWRWDGASWTRVSSPQVEASDYSRIASMCACSHADLLFAGVASQAGCAVYTYDGTGWTAGMVGGFGTDHNKSVPSMAEYGGRLYAGTLNNVDGCEVWSWESGTGTWTPRVGSSAPLPAGWGDADNGQACSMAVFDDGVEKLWVGTGNAATGGQLIAYDGTDWQTSQAGGFGDANNACITSVVPHDDGGGGGPVLYAGTRNASSGCELYKLAGTWTCVVGSGGGSAQPPGFADADNRSIGTLASFGTDLVAGTAENDESGCQLWSMDPACWSRINDNGFAANNQDSATCQASIGEDLYVGTCNRTTGGRVWRYGSGNWEWMKIPGFSYHNAAVSAMAVRDGELWIGTSNRGGAEVWMYDGAGWKCMVGPGGQIGLDAGNTSIPSLAVSRGKVWFGTANETGGCEVWRQVSGGWERAAAGGFGDASNVTASGIRGFGGAVYAGTANENGCGLYRWLDGTWSTEVGPGGALPPGFGNPKNRSAGSCAVYDGALVVGTRNSSSGCEVWSFDGLDWSLSAGGGFGDSDNVCVASMTVSGGRLFAGTEKYPGGGSGCEVWMINGAGWRLVNNDGFGDVRNTGATALAGCGPGLYAGTYNRDAGFEVWWRSAAPSIATVSPEQASGGATVTVRGVNFGREQGSSRVQLGSMSVPECAYWSDGMVRFEVPPGAAGKLGVSITTFAGTSNSKTITVICPVWYLAEGSSAWGFDTYVTVQNPNAQALEARVTYMTDEGAVARPDLDLPPTSQTTINPRDDLGSKDFSMRVECLKKKNIVVDRRMVWTGQGAASPEGHSSVGVTAPAKAWFLPEGSSRWGFECWLLVQNPNPVEAVCRITYMIEGGPALDVMKSVEANSRDSFNIADDVGAADVSIMVSSDQPVIPERAMYRNGRREGHGSIGTVSPAESSYLAEGSTAWGFTTYVLIQNPNASDTRVTVTYMTSDGPVVQPVMTLPGKSRRTIRVNDVLPAKDFSTSVSGDRPLIAERAMYWDNTTGEACHDSIGMSAPHKSFCLPDGETYNGHETFTLVQNPNDVEVNVKIEYFTNGETEDIAFSSAVPANSRRTFDMRDRIPAGKSSILVTSTTPGMRIVCERAMYWSSRGAGTDTIGGCLD